MSSIPKAEMDKEDGEAEPTGEGQEIKGIGDILGAIPKRDVEFKKRR